MVKSVDYTQLTIGYFQAIGLCPSLIPITPANDSILLAVIVLNVTGLTVATILMYIYAPLIFYINETDIIGSLTDIIQTAGIYLAHFVMLAETVCTNRMRKRMWQLYQRIDHRLSVQLGIDLRAEYKRAMRWFAWKAFAVHGGCFAIEMRVMLYVTENEPWSRHWYFSIYTMIVCRSMHLFYMLFVDMLRLRMDIVSKQLEVLGGRELNIVEQQQRLALLKKSYNRLWMISEMMRQSFGWSVLMNVTANFICSAVNLYWNYTALYFGTNPWWKESLMASLPIFIVLATLCHSSEMCQRSVSYILIK